MPVCWQRFALPRRKPHKWMLRNYGWGRRCVFFVEISKPAPGAAHSGYSEPLESRSQSSPRALVHFAWTSWQCLTCGVPHGCQKSHPSSPTLPVSSGWVVPGLPMVMCLGTAEIALEVCGKDESGSPRQVCVTAPAGL